jgi:glutamate racemase
VRIVTSGEAIVDAVEHELDAAGSAASHDRRGDYRFLATGDADEFRRLGTRFLQLPIVKVGHVAVAAPAEAAA